MIPILYSFRRCPFAIRARMALFYSGINVEIKEVLLKDKPLMMLSLSPKGTVPVLISSDGIVLDESYQIMLWAINISDPDHWYPSCMSKEIDDLVYKNDHEFKSTLDKYKYSDRHPENSKTYYRTQGEYFLIFLEEKLKSNNYLLGDKVSLADIAIFPFIRQFAFVDIDWFESSRYIKLREWLSTILASKMFNIVMKKTK
ncbi:MAG: glutathione S-transferase [Cellvibrionales bacterium]|jgi:glutathione S-transferase|nr:glutathione S-transferase [Cellvibrionales bacterium]MCH9797970.1 glutathione S-transferase [Gammaproteobacteria bacterium]MDA7737576.1 glutathione S-transferase [Porticoccus sp.]MCH9843212.1 glutathione S-transferase [Gammaproteobacteria bacterium]MDC0888131.1 glutathione S-transferase [Porticoccus sp.]